MSKPPARTVPSDDFYLTVDEVAYQPHEGEWVKVLNHFAVHDLQVLKAVRQMSVEVDAVRGEANEKDRVLEVMEKPFAELCELLADRVVAWNWTDDAERPMPPPSVASIRGLRAEEISYLMRLVQGEGTAERKNGSEPLPTTSSDTESPPTTSSTGGRSRTRASSR